MFLLRLFWACTLALVLPRNRLALRLIACEQQLLLFERTCGNRKKRVTRWDRLFWVLLSRLWDGWRESLIVARPATVLRWRRNWFRYYWRWKSGKPGRPRIPLNLIALIRRMSKENPLWGEDRIHGELLKLGLQAAPSTIRKYMAKHRRPSSPTWRIFLKSHADQIWACDFFTVPLGFTKRLFVFFFIGHDRRRIIHFGVTTAPSAEWSAQQYINAILDQEKVPRFLLRDRDSCYGAVFRDRSEHCGTRNLIAPIRAPKFNAIAERFVRTVRRECLDHRWITNEAQLLTVLKEYVAFYNTHRPHQGLGQKTPIPREGAIQKKGTIVSIPVLGGLQHYYERRSA